MTVGLYTAYGILIARQWNGDYLCSSLYVQFSDETTVFDSGLSPGHYSGYFLAQGFSPRERFNSRTQYMDASNAVRLLYCTDLEAWVFVNPGVVDEVDYCTNFFAKSSTTTTLDVTTVGGDSWLTFSTAAGGVYEVVVDWLFITCRDCQVERDLCPEDRGTCLENRSCQCKPGFIGLSCEFRHDESCQDLLATDDNELESLGLDTIMFDFTIEPDRTTVREVNQRPIMLNSQTYVYTPTPVMMFSGRRWTIYAAEKDAFLPKIEFKRSRWDVYFKSNETVIGPFDMLKLLDEWKLRPFLVSEVMDYGSPRHLLTPQNLQFYHTKRLGKGWIVDYQRPISNTYTCFHCTGDDPCLHGGICAREFTGFVGLGDCECVNGYEGNRCEVAPFCSTDSDCFGNATCDTETATCNCGVLAEHRGGNLCQFLNDTTRECNNKKCYNNGKCHFDSDLHGMDTGNVCLCDDAHFGPECQFKKGENHVQYCGATICQNNQLCVYTDNHAKDYCLCRIPYYGDACQYIRDETNPASCFGKTCLNGGTCTYRDPEIQNFIQLYKPTICKCPDGFYGNLCDYKKNDADPSQCYEETCLNGGACMYNPPFWDQQCECPETHYGKFCELEKAEKQCYNLQCQNNSTCVSRYSPVTEENPWCDCDHEFYGRACQFEKDMSNSSECASGTCLNGGRCAYDHVDDTPLCRCMHPFFGKICQYQKHQHNNTICNDKLVCLNGGDCHFQLFYNNWAGYDDDDFNPTRNEVWPADNHFWNDDVPQYDPSISSTERHEPQCRCKGDFYGRACQYKKDHLNPHRCFNFTCENQGRCNFLDWRQPHCFCDAQYSGNRCQEEKSRKRRLRQDHQPTRL